jgi:carbon storage regulator
MDVAGSFEDACPNGYVGEGVEAEMLVLTRKPGQSIIIGDGIEVQVLSVAGEKVRLGITAPRDVDIFRDEVYHRIEAEAAAESVNGSREVEDALERLSP